MLDGLYYEPFEKGQWNVLLLPLFGDCPHPSIVTGHNLALIIYEKWLHPIGQNREKWGILRRSDVDRVGEKINEK